MASVTKSLGVVRKSLMLSSCEDGVRRAVRSLRIRRLKIEGVENADTYFEITSWKLYVVCRLCGIILITGKELF